MAASAHVSSAPAVPCHTSNADHTHTAAGVTTLNRWSRRRSNDVGEAASTSIAGSSNANPMPLARAIATNSRGAAALCPWRIATTTIAIETAATGGNQGIARAE